MKLAGTVRWAVVPYVPEPPFRIYAGEGRSPYEISHPSKLVDAVAKHADAEFTFLVTGKPRPVLILNDPPPRGHQQVSALRLLKLSKLSRAEQEDVRHHQDRLLFHIAPQRFRLPYECAALISEMVTVGVGAIDPRDVGELNTREQSVLGERVVAFYNFDVTSLLERRIVDLASRSKQR